MDDYSLELRLTLQVQGDYSILDAQIATMTITTMSTLYPFQQCVFALNSILYQIPLTAIHNFVSV